MARGENSAHGANAEIIVRIRSTLQGPVMATMRQLVPELGHVPADLAYDHTLGSIYLLDRCFQTFREKRDRFRHLLVDAAGNPVVDGSGRLACGRSL
ncbi:MAG: hypothetical protein HY985_09425 [Magnetospirillum sp.]|nr:hypothetical protein [Magnetospirillum sp.]